MKCDYVTCEKEATVTGVVFGIDKENPEQGLKPFPVNACDHHKTKNGFFEGD